MKRDSIDLQNGDITTLFRRLLIPTLLGTISMSAMTVIDGMIVGHGVGAVGVAAVNIVVPIYQLISGLGLMIGAGCSVVVSIHLANAKLKVARLNVTQAIVAALTVVALIVAAMALFLEPVSRMLGASETLLPHVIDYTKWLLPGFVFEMLSLIGLFIIRLDGAPRYAMWCNIVPAVLNALLDYIFVFPCDMGVMGAGVATSLCMSLGGIMALYYLVMPSHKLHLELPKLSLKSLALSLRNVGYQCWIGISSLLGELSLAMLIFIGNIVFMRYLGDDGVGAFGISCYYTPFFFMIGNSIAQSAQPLLSYNYGIARWSHVVRVRRLSLLTSLIFGLVVTLLFMGVPKAMVALFVDAESTAGVLATEGFPLYGLGIIFFILNVAIIGYFQSIERLRSALSIVVLRGLVFVIPCFMLLPEWLGRTGIWLAMPLSEALTFVVAAILLRRSSN